MLTVASTPREIDAHPAMIAPHLVGTLAKVSFRPLHAIPDFRQCTYFCVDPNSVCLFNEGEKSHAGKIQNL